MRYPLFPVIAIAAAILNNFAYSYHPGLDRPRLQSDHIAAVGDHGAAGDRRRGRPGSGDPGPHRPGAQLRVRVPGATRRAGRARRALRQPAGQEPDLPRPAAHRRHHGARHQRRALRQSALCARADAARRFGDGNHRAAVRHQPDRSPPAARAAPLPGGAGDHGMGLQPPPESRQPAVARAVRLDERRPDRSHLGRRGRQGQRPGTLRVGQVHRQRPPLSRPLHPPGPHPGVLPADPGVRGGLGGRVPVGCAAVAGRRDQRRAVDQLHRAGGHAALPDLYVDVDLQPGADGHRQRQAHPGNDQHRNRAG